MPKTVITPSAKGAPFWPGALADGVVYEAGALAFEKNNQAHI